MLMFYKQRKLDVYDVDSYLKLSLSLEENADDEDSKRKTLYLKTLVV